MASITIPYLPAELHAQIISYLSLDDQICAAKVCKSWRHILTSSRSIRKSRYSSKIAKGTHSLISTKSECFHCVVKGKHSREYYFRGNRLRDDCPFLDEPFFSPSGWNGEDPDLAHAMDCIEFNLFTSVAEVSRLIWWGTSPWGRDVTVRGFIEAMLKPVFDAPSAGPETTDGSLTFFLAVQLIASAYTIAPPRPKIQHEETTEQPELGGTTSQDAESQSIP